MSIFNNDKKIGRVFHGSREINKIYQGDKLVFQKLKPEGYIEIEIDSSSGSFMVPFAQRFLMAGGSYPFKIYVNGSLYGTTTITNPSHVLGTGYNITGLNGPTARIMLTPTGQTVSAGWGRCFGFYSGTTGCNILTNKAKLLKVLNDPDYAHLNIETNVADYFKQYQFHNCVNLTQIPDEDMPDTVTGIGYNFRDGQYSGCTSLITPAVEYIPSGMTNNSIAAMFRQYQYRGCTSLIKAADEVFPSGITTIGDHFRGFQYSGCTNLTQAAEEVMSTNIQTIASYFRQGQYQGCTSLTLPAEEVLPNGLRTIGDHFRGLQYNGCTSLTQAVNEEVLPDTLNSIGTFFRRNQYSACRNLTQAAIEKMPSGTTNNSGGFRYGQYSTCESLLIGSYIHSYRFNTLLNQPSGANFYQMFAGTVTAPDTAPRYYTDAAQTTTALVTTLTPTESKRYFQNRTGIEGYNTVDVNWRF